VLPPGKSLTNAVYAAQAKKRLVRKGTMDPTFEMRHESLVGVEAWGDPVTAILETQNPNDEALDRRNLPPGHRAEDVVRLGRKNVDFEPGEQEWRRPLPADGSFGIKTAQD
jgi:hypothetical protein